MDNGVMAYGIQCKSCGAMSDPQFRYCTQCGKRLPKAKDSIDSKGHKSHGVKMGIEPDKQSLDKEPVYSLNQAQIEATLPMMRSGMDSWGRIRTGNVIPSKPPGGRIVAGMSVIAFLLPHFGIFTAVAWLIFPRFRRAALLVLLATVIGATIWGAILVR